jgi:hypothetical protein
MAHKKRCKVFVSYSRHDEVLVKPLAGLLGAAANDSVFLDVTSLKPGDYWEPEIERAVRESSVFVLCWCCQSERSGFVTREIRMALGDAERRIVPVLFCSVPLPASLASRQWIDLQGKVVHECIAHSVSESAKPKETLLTQRERRETRISPAEASHPRWTIWVAVDVAVFLVAVSYGLYDMTAGGLRGLDLLYIALGAILLCLLIPLLYSLAKSGYQRILAAYRSRQIGKLADVITDYFARLGGNERKVSNESPHSGR